MAPPRPLKTSPYFSSSSLPRINPPAPTSRKVRGLTQLPPLPVRLQAREIRLLRRVGGVAAEEEAQGRLLQAHDMEDHRRSLGGVSGLLAVVVALVLGELADGGFVFGAGGAEGGGGAGEVGAEGSGL